MQATRIGVVGTGFIATGLTYLINQSSDFAVSCVLTRRPLNTLSDFPTPHLTHSLQQVLDTSDIVVECSGDAIHATEVILAATQAGKKVVTINSEFHVTTGSYFAQRGDYVTEADGDQPGCLARLKLEVEGMGFKPRAYINLKGFLNPDPTEADMQYWSEKQNLALDQVVSFTDGTKLQIEQAFVANGLGGTIAPGGITGRRIEKLEDLDYLVEIADEVGLPLADFVLCNGAPPGVLIVGQHPDVKRIPGYLPYSRLSTTGGLGTVLLRPYHLTHLEVLNTLRQVVADAPILLNNSARPRVNVAAVAKRNIKPGEVIKKGAGGFDVRGKAVEIIDVPDAVPICLLQHTRIVRELARDDIVRFEHVELADTQALGLYREILENVLPVTA